VCGVWCLRLALNIHGKPHPDPQTASDFGLRAPRMTSGLRAPRCIRHSKQGFFCIRHTHSKLHSPFAIPSTAFAIPSPNWILGSVPTSESSYTHRLRPRILPTSTEVLAPGFPTIASFPLALFCPYFGALQLPQGAPAPLPTHLRCRHPCILKR